MTGFGMIPDMLVVNAFPAVFVRPSDVQLCAATFIIPTVGNFDGQAAQLFYMPQFHPDRDAMLNVQGVFF